MAEILARVKAGESFVITQRGRAVACLVPVGFGIETRRPAMAAGRVRAGDDFDEPLPEDLLGAFEQEDPARRS